MFFHGIIKFSLPIFKALNSYNILYVSEQIIIKDLVNVKVFYPHIIQIVIKTYHVNSLKNFNCPIDNVTLRHNNHVPKSPNTDP